MKKAVHGGTNGYELSLATTKTDASSQKVFFRINQVTNGDTYRINSTTEYPIDGTWMHVLATFDGATMNLYINGILESSLTVPAGTVIETNNLPLGIGAQSDGIRWFMGGLDEARVYNRTLTLAEIQTLAGVAPLSVSKTGTGSGTVTSVPAGIDCGGTCSYIFPYNSLVTLTAAPALGSTFTGWSGAGCTGAGTCAVTMDAAKTVTANFDLEEYTLTIEKTGNGTVTKSPDQLTYHYGDVIALTATPDAGWSFTGWSANVVSGNVTINSNTTVTATFTQTVATHSIDLVLGWNLISFRVHPQVTDTSTVLASIEGNYDLVYAWDASVTSDNWLMYDPAMPFGNTLNHLDETMGFWIHMTAEDALVVTGNIPVTTNINLYTGWNMAGYPSEVNRPFPDVLRDNGVGDNFTLVYAYHANDASPWKMYDPAMPFGNDLTEMEPGWGYWIWVDTDCTWSVEYQAE